MTKFDKMGTLPDIEIGQGRRNVYMPAPVEVKPALQATQAVEKPAIKPPATEAAGVVDNLVFEKKQTGRSINLYMRQETIDKLAAAASEKGVSSSKLLETLLNQVL
jgi:hypothetical protein